MCPEPFHGAWRGAGASRPSGLSGLFGSFGLSGSRNESNQINQSNYTNKNNQPIPSRSCHTLYAISHMLFSSCPSLTQGSGTLPLIDTALRFPQAPPRMSLPGGPHALLDSPLPSLPRALLRLIQRWPIPRPRHHVESPLYRLASLRRSAHATRGNLFADCHAPEYATARRTWGARAVENPVIEAQTHARLQHDVTRLVQEPAEDVL